MRILVLNGSPKGDLSVTMQYVNYLAKMFPDHEMAIHNISQRINSIEADEMSFWDIMDGVRSSDGVLWVFPLYLLLVPSQYKRFIELIPQRGAEDAFKSKYTAVLTTSIHFHDHAAHEYMNAIYDIWGRFRFVFQADHRHYRRQGLYDFPQRDYRTRIQNALMMLLTRVPKIRRDIYVNRLRREMVKPFKKILKR